jgi:V8-like Glu-specific endopeptidase
MTLLKQLVVLFGFFAAAACVRAEEEDFNTQMMRATVKISHEKSTATGFILAKGKEDRYLLVTAAHVLETTPGEETTVIFRRKTAEGEYEKEPTKLSIRKGDKPLWAKHPTEDVAALWIVPPKGVDLSRVSTDVIADDGQLRKYKIHPGTDLDYLGYPHREEGSKAGFPLLRQGSIATYPLLPTAKTKTYFLSANTFEGDSGGPVYWTRSKRAEADKEETRLIVGLVSAQIFLDEEMKMVYGTTKMRHRLGFAIIVHGSFIKETVEMVK